MTDANHPLSGPIFTAPADAERCDGCGKSGHKLLPIIRGLWECSAVECPMRRRVTAQRREELNDADS